MEYKINSGVYKKNKNIHAKFVHTWPETEKTNCLSQVYWSFSFWGWVKKKDTCMRVKYSKCVSRLFPTQHNKRGEKKSCRRNPTAEQSILLLLFLVGWDLVSNSKYNNISAHLSLKKELSTQLYAWVNFYCSLIIARKRSFMFIDCAWMHYIPIYV